MTKVAFVEGQLFIDAAEAQIAMRVERDRLHDLHSRATEERRQANGVILAKIQQQHEADVKGVVASYDRTLRDYEKQIADLCAQRHDLQTRVAVLEHDNQTLKATPTDVGQVLAPKREQRTPK